MIIYKAYNADSLKVISDIWKQYEQREVSIATKSDDPAMNLRNNSIAEWQAQGYECYELTELESELPADVYQSFYNEVQNQSNQDYIDYAVVRVKNTYHNSDGSYLLTTTWEQTNGYNSAMSSTCPAGCANIATAAAGAQGETKAQRKKEQSQLLYHLLV